MKTTILIILLFSTKIVCGQNDSIKVKRHNSNAPTLHELSEENKQRGIDNKVSLFVPLLPLIDPYSGFSPRLGGEFKIYRNASICIEGGGYFYSQPKLSWLDNLSGFIGKAGLKYYLNKKQLTIGNYILIDYVYKHQNYTLTDSIKIDSLPTFQKKYSVDKFVNGMTLKYGYTYLLKKRIYLDLYVGLGIRHIKLNTNLTNTENENILTGEGNGSFTESLIKSKGTVPVINAGIKLGYRIK